MNDPAAPNNRQREHYETIADVYALHYYDADSMAYRRNFIYPALFGGLELQSKRVAELACGAGANSAELRMLFPNAALEGFDISPSACEAYRDRLGTPAHLVDLTLPQPAREPFDFAFVVGGLHHCTGNLDTAFANIASLVRPGGTFAMLEPNRRHLLEPLRRLWYRLDPSFDADNERALDHDELLAIGKTWFRLRRLSYFGGPAFYVIFNSMILRVPPRWKPRLAPPFFAMERAWNRIAWPRMHGVFVAQWERL